MSVQSVERQQLIYLPMHRAQRIADPLDYSPLAKKNIYIMTHAQEYADYRERLKNELFEQQEIYKQKQCETKIKYFTSQITAAECAIDALRPKNFISRIVFAILSFIGINSRIIDIESYRDFLIMTQNSYADLQKDWSNLFSTYSRLLKSSEVDVSAEINHEMHLILDSVHTQYQDVTIDGKAFTEPTALFTALKTIVPRSPVGQYTFLKLTSPVCLPQLLVNAAQDYLNRIYGQNHPYLVERMEGDKVSISIAQDPHDGTFAIGYTGKQRVLDERGRELFTFNSSIVVHLDAEGTVVDADATFDVATTNEHTPPLIAFDPNLPVAPPEDDDRYATVTATIEGAVTPLRIAKGHTLDTYRCIGKLFIGSESLEPKHRAKREQNERLNQQWQRVKSYGEGTQSFSRLSTRLMRHSETLMHQQQQFFESHQQEIRKDFLVTLHRKLGADRIHLLPYVSELFHQGAVSLPEQFLIAKCQGSEESIQKFAATRQFKIRLDIPEDRVQPVKIVATERGVVNGTPVEATTTYTFSNVGVVSAETIAT